MPTLMGLLEDYRSGRRDLRRHIADTMAAIRSGNDRNIWITVLDDKQLEPYLVRLQGADPADYPLYGIPFAIKDNIDLAAVATTAACPDYSYVPQESAFVVQRLVAAGAIPVGKTNLDQFATGLVGTRSPHGACGNAFDPRYIAGGSSSGSAVAVALGQVGFSLGTDTAGSGRVPAAFNNLVGLKPSRGVLSSRGVVPACRTLDTVSIFANTAGDAQRVLDVSARYDAQDAYARPDRVPDLGHATIPLDYFRFGVPRHEQLAFFGNPSGAALFEQAVERLEHLGGVPVEVDFGPFLEAARLLYEGPWVAERYAAIREFFERQPESLLDVTRQIIGQGAGPLAADAFAAQYRLQGLRRRTEALWSEVDMVITPTAGTIYTIAEVAAEPVARNSDLGYYTNFMNLLDFSAVAVPAGFQADGLPFGITLFAPAFYDHDLLAIADHLHRKQDLPLGATGEPMPEEPVVRATHQHSIPVAVCGAHMRGLPLNHQLEERQGRFRETTRTAPEYRLYALPDGPPERPGLLHVGTGGESISLEIWDVPADQFGSFVDSIPTPLGIARVRLEDGRQVAGFVCEAIGTESAEDITSLGNWRVWLEQTRQHRVETPLP